MEESIVPIYTLREVIDWQKVDLVNKNIWAFDMHPLNMKEIELDRPSKVICFGLFLVQRGQVDLNVDFNELKLKKNDTVNLFPYNILEFKSFSKDCRIKVVLISIDYLSELNLEITSQQAFKILSHNFLKLVSLDDPTASTIVDTIKNIQKLNDPANLNMFNLEMLKLHFSLLMFSLATFTQTQLKNDNFNSNRKENIAIKFVTLINQNFRQHKDVQYYADLLFISRTHLTRVIKEVFNINPKQIIDDKLISETKILLLKNQLSITEIMTDLNFEDQATFSKFFKKNTGFTPTSYRKQQ